MAREPREPLGVVVGGVAKPFPEWTHGDKFPNARTMHRDAANAVATYEQAQKAVLANEDLTEQGQGKALDKAVQDFDQLHQRWTRNVDMIKRREIMRIRLRDLRGGRRRDPDDVSGQLSDREDREYFMSLKGEEKTDLIGAMQRGEEPDLTAAVLRKSPRQMGFNELSVGLREKLEAVSVNPEDLPEAADLRAELSAMQQADDAFEAARREVLGLATKAGVTSVAAIHARDALERDGVQRVAGEHRVEPFVAPEVAPFEKDGEGVIDLKRTRASDLAKKTGQA